jgi:hypothetical protein
MVRETTEKPEVIAKMTRRELIDYLESRGTACFREDTTKELRECALEDAGVAPGDWSKHGC